MASPPPNETGAASGPDRDSDTAPTRSPTVPPTDEVAVIAEAQLRLLRRFARLVAQALREELQSGKQKVPP